MAHHCYQCGSIVETRMADHREREVCPKCGWVYYVQPKVGAAVIIEQNNKLLLIQRAHEPWVGSWMTPAGYVEADEDPRDAARREVFEETGLDVEIGDFVKTYYFSDDPRGSGIVFVYKAIKVSGDLRINHEALDGKYFAYHEIPAYITKAGQDKIIAEWCTQAKQRESAL